MKVPACACRKLPMQMDPQVVQVEMMKLTTVSGSVELTEGIP